MKKYDQQSSRLFITVILFLFFYTYSFACTCPPSGPGPTCTTAPSFSVTVCNVDIIEVTFFNYTTFGSLSGEFCACGFNMPPEITEVQNVRIVNASTQIDLAEFAFTQNATTATEFDNLMSGNWEGFSSSVSGTVSAGISINIIFTVRVTDCTTATIEGAIAGINVIGTAGATAGGVPNNHICIPPPPVVPIELSHFSGDTDGTNIRLSWETLSEINNAYFSIERSSTGDSFTEIARMEGAGNSISSIIYNYVDKSPASGINYYRLKQVDFDNSFEYSEVLSIESLVKETRLRVFPNPIQNGELHLSLPDTRNEEKDLAVYNCVGHLVLRHSFQNSETQLQIDDLPEGVYLLSVNMNGKTFWEKVVVN